MARAHTCPPPTEVPPETLEPLIRPPARPIPRRRQQMVHRSILNMERQIVTLEGKEVLTELYRQTALQIIKMLESLCSEFQMYHYEIVDNIETDEDETREQEVLDEHQKKIIEFVDRLENLIARPQPGASTPASTKGRLTDRQIDITEGSMKIVQRDLEKPESVDIHNLLDYTHEIKSLEGELQGVKKYILCLDDFGERSERVSNIKLILSKLRISISRLTEEIKKEPDPKVVEMPMMDSVNLPRIEVPMFDGNILIWWPFCEQFRAAVHDKPHLREVD